MYAAILVERPSTLGRIHIDLLEGVAPLPQPVYYKYTLPLGENPKYFANTLISLVAAVRPILYSYSYDNLVAYGCTLNVNRHLLYPTIALMRVRHLCVA